MYRLVGACVQPNPNFVNNPLYLIMEYAPGGVFRHYLQDQEFLVTTNQICRMCTDACKVSICMDDINLSQSVLLENHSFSSVA